MIALNAEGKPHTIPSLMLMTEEEKKACDKAERIYEQAVQRRRSLKNGTN